MERDIHSDKVCTSNVISSLKARIENWLMYLGYLLSGLSS